MLSKMSFPFSVIPNFVIFSKLYVHLFMLGVTIIILQFNGFYISLHYVQLIYFMFSTVALLFAISLITSTISTIIRDFHMFLNSTRSEERRVGKECIATPSTYKSNNQESNSCAL